MKTFTLRYVIGCCISLILFSCQTLANRTNSQGAVTTNTAQIDFGINKIVDSKGSAAGVVLPAMFRDILLGQTRSYIERKYFDGEITVFISNEVGKNLEVLRLWAKNLDVNAEVAKYLSTAVTNVASSERQAGAINTEQFDGTAKVAQEAASKVKFSGLRMEQDWWIKKKIDPVGEDGQNNYTSPDFDYQYIVVYGISSENLAKAQDLYSDVLEQDLLEELGFEAREDVVKFLNTLRDRNFGLDDDMPVILPVEEAEETS